MKRGKTPIHRDGVVAVLRLGFMKQSFEWIQQWRRIAFSEVVLPCSIAFPNRFFLFIPITLNFNLTYSSLLSLSFPLPFLPKTTSNFPTTKGFSTLVAFLLSISSYPTVHLLSLYSSLYFILKEFCYFLSIFLQLIFVSLCA